MSRIAAAGLACVVLSACGADAGYTLPASHNIVDLHQSASAAPSATPTAKAWWSQPVAAATPTVRPAPTPDTPPPTTIDLCAMPAQQPRGSVTAVLQPEGPAPAGGRARGEIDNLTNADGDGSLDVKAYGCGLDNQSANRYYVQLLVGTDGCQVTDPPSQVYLQVGYLALLDDNRTLYVINGSRSNSTPVPSRTSMAIYDAGPNAQNRNSPQLIFCGQLTQ